MLSNKQILCSYLFLMHPCFELCLKSIIIKCTKFQLETYLLYLVKVLYKYSQYILLLRHYDRYISFLPPLMVKQKILNKFCF